MEFALSEDQKMFQRSIRGFLDSAAPLDRVRQVAAGDIGTASAISRDMTELGTSAIMVPEADGGLGLGLLDAALVQEALGAAVAPAAHLAGAMAAVGIAHAGTEAQKSEWLERIAANDVRIGVAVAEHVGAREGAGVTAEGTTLSGKSLFALETADATHVLLSTKDGNLHLVAMDADKLTRIPLTTIDRTRDYAELVLDGVPALALSGENMPGRAADLMVGAGRLLLAADTLGAAQAMLDKSVAYAAERKQFDRAIGSFQAVKHMCAEMAAVIEPARALIWHAAHAFDTGDDDAALMICLAKSHLSEIGTFVARTATEVHGGMGFTDLVGLHYWFKRIGANRQLLGGPEAVRAEAARLQGWA